MRGRKIIRISFLVLTLLVLVVIVFRNTFQYNHYSDYAALYGPCTSECFNTWAGFRDDFPDSELVRAKRISDSVIGNGKHDTQEKLLLLSCFVYRKFYRQLGNPAPSLLMQSPMQQYDQLDASHSTQLWCVNFAQILGYFCWSQGIVTRNIEIRKPGDHHVLNECYLPEKGQWVLTDLTNNLLLVKNREGLLNTVQLIALAGNGGIQALRTNDSSIVEAALGTGENAVPAYYLNSYPMFYYHRANIFEAYNTTNKTRAFFLPVSWYEIYDAAGRNNFPFYLKEIFILLWVISFIALLVSSSKNRL